MLDAQFSPMRDLRGYMKPHTAHKVIAAGKTTRDQLLMKILFIGGPRVSEEVDERWGIRPKDLVPDDNVIIFRTLKRRQKKKDSPTPPPERRVVIPSWLMKELADYCANTPADQRIFPITRQRVFQIVRAAGEEAGVLKVGKKRIHPHHFRHSHCVAYIQANNTVEGLRKLQQRLNHANINTTAGYLQFALEGERKKIEEIFKPLPTGT